MSIDARLLHSVSTVCEHGAMCVHDKPGHGLGIVQRRLARATSGWVDAIVLDVDADGWLTLVPLDDAQGTATASAADAWEDDWAPRGVLRFWQHADLTGVIAPGEPVAVHTRYAVLAIGGALHNVAPV